MVEHWGLPDSVKECQREFASGPVTRLGDGHRDFLHAVVSFGHSLTEAVYRTDGIPVAKGKLQRAAGCLCVIAGRIAWTRCSGSSIRAWKKRAKRAGCCTFRSTRLRLKQQIEAAERSETPGREAIDEWKSRIDGGEYDLNEVLVGVLETAHQLGPFDRALFALVDAATNTIHGRLGVGEDVDSLSQAFQLSALAAGRADCAFDHAEAGSVPLRAQRADGVPGGIGFVELRPLSGGGGWRGAGVLMFCDRKNPAVLPSQTQKLCWANAATWRRRR
jgi:predicted small secreted protein